MAHVPFNKARYNNLSKDSVIQVQHKAINDTKQLIQQTSLAASGSEITGLSIDFVPKFADSKILITAMVNYTPIWAHAFGIKRDSNLLAQGGHGIIQGASYNQYSTAGTQSNSSDGGVISSIFFLHDSTTNNDRKITTNLEYLDDADSTSSRTYKICAVASFAGGITNLIIGDRNSNGMSDISSMTIYEIKQ